MTIANFAVAIKGIGNSQTFSTTTILKILPPSTVIWASKKLILASYEFYLPPSIVKHTLLVMRPHPAGLRGLTDTLYGIPIAAI